ncbi:MAG: helix-hairpin-helix domain-containing protein [Anaerolineae bacterium]|jgi:competence ComEA-like helix-hairpin-helix protein
MNEQRINVNTATAEELTQLPGIGPALAQRIVTYRDTVRLFEEPSHITAVSGIGDGTYRALADRLAVAAPDELSRLEGEVAAGQERIEEVGETSAEPATEERTPAEAKALSEEEILLEEQTQPEVEAVPAGEPFLEEELTFVEEAELETLETADLPEETMEEAPPELSDVPEGVIEGAPTEAQELPADEVAAPEVEEKPAEEPADAEPVSRETRRPPAPSRSLWRRLSWLWTALLGGLLGMAFALVVFSAVNGSLDVGHSRAVVDVRGRMDSLATDISSLQGEVDGLRGRLDALEELTVRMDRIEAGVGDLQAATADLSQRADALERRVDTVVEEIETVSEQVATLQDRAEQARSFFQGLQTLVNDVFGAVEGESTVTPTPTPEGK